ncbi:MAG: HD domain-containing protein [Deltaproteobacteria bacterium]|jgi:uncharacterized protein|nr:HD domain-containing protein [Deltaproteobacteria bacterium]MBW2532474.1 HD domain-containing protein [Deltaproteobacteria bacterium]
MISSEQLDRLRGQARSRAGSDPAHDWLHVRRVEHGAERIARAEGARVDVVCAAAVLHELFSYPKGHPDSHLSGQRCAEQAAELMRAEGMDEENVLAVAECIRVHPFSAGIVPQQLEAQVLQDADRLDAIGAIGVARCFATCAQMGRPFYAEEDPLARGRPHDDKRFGLDHFHLKLLRLAEQMHTATGRVLAAERHGFLEVFLEQLGREIGASRPSGS